MIDMIKIKKFLIIKAIYLQKKIIISIQILRIKNQQTIINKILKIINKMINIVIIK